MNKIGRECALLSLCTVIVSSAALLKLSDRHFTTNNNRLLYKSGDIVSQDLQEDLGIGTIKYYIENDVNDDKYQAIIDRIEQKAQMAGIENLEVIKSDVLGGFYFYGAGHKLGDYISYDESMFGPNKNKWERQGTKLKMIYPIKTSDDAKEVYGYISMTLDIEDIIAYERGFQTRLVILLAIVGLAQVLLNYLFIKSKVSNPLNEIVGALDAYNDSSRDDEAKTIDVMLKRKSNFIANLDLETNNEIEDICSHLRLLEYDLNKQIDDLVAMKRSAEEQNETMKLFEVIASIQTIVLRQLYVDFKSVLPMILLYFKADRVLYITQDKTGKYSIDSYSKNKKYVKYDSADVEFCNLIATTTSSLSGSLRKIALQDYSITDKDMIVFGNLKNDTKWEMIIINSSLDSSSTEAELLIRAIECCMRVFLKGEKK